MKKLLDKYHELYYNIDMKTTEEVRGMEKLIDLKQAVEILEKARQDFPFEHVVMYENIDENEDIIGCYIMFVLYEDYNIQLAIEGWIELDRRDNTSNPYIWFAGTVVVNIDNKERAIFGGGYNDDYRVIRMDYDIQKEKWEGFTIDTL